ncbi:hypothetical protein BDA99DRAFT_314045 [Phascolomyces articulosus]|uniref:Uncharacterized protein n=1 Tax=Phascolomyces articulosus TaxID=60185 RepID=A0AAD5JKW6_9FUNG|nr:hypothetical protein BDA99DRAFT_314045 [Phascolomyces articulosus]
MKKSQSYSFHGSVNAPVQAVIGQVKNSNPPFSNTSIISIDQTHEEVEPEGTEPGDTAAEDYASLTDYNVDADLPSDLTNDYHSLQNLDYSFESIYDNDDGSSEQEQLDTSKDENPALATSSISSSASSSTSSNAPIDTTSGTNQYHQHSWKVKEVDVLFQLKKMREKSLKLEPKTLSDLDFCQLMIFIFLH